MSSGKPSYCSYPELKFAIELCRISTIAQRHMSRKDVCGDTSWGIMLCEYPPLTLHRNCRRPHEARVRSYEAPCNIEKQDRHAV
jgi:hypothetical protein